MVVGCLLSTCDSPGCSVPRTTLLREQVFDGGNTAQCSDIHSTNAHPSKQVLEDQKLETPSWWPGWIEGCCHANPHQGCWVMVSVRAGSEPGRVLSRCRCRSFCSSSGDALVSGPHPVCEAPASLPLHVHHCSNPGVTVC